MSVVSQDVQILMFKLLSGVYKEHPGLPSFLFLHPSPHPCRPAAAVWSHLEYPELPGCYSPFVTAQVPPTRGKSPLISNTTVLDNTPARHVLLLALNKNTLSVHCTPGSALGRLGGQTGAAAPAGLSLGPSLHHLSYHTVGSGVPSSGYATQQTDL